MKIKYALITFLLALFLIGVLTTKADYVKVNAFWQKQAVDLMIKKGMNPMHAQVMLQASKAAIEMQKQAFLLSLQGQKLDPQQAKRFLMEKIAQVSLRPTSAAPALSGAATPRPLPPPNTATPALGGAATPRALPSPNTAAPATKEEILMELKLEGEDVLFDENSPSSAADQTLIATWFDQTQEENQALLQDIQNTFGVSVQTQALNIIVRTEQALARAAAKAATARNYAAKANQIKNTQAHELNLLYQNNSKKIKQVL